MLARATRLPIPQRAFLASTRPHQLLLQQSRTFASTFTRFSNSKDNKVKAASFDSFNEEVIASSVPVIVDFHANWCMPCKLLRPILEKVVAKTKDIRMVTVDVDEEYKLAKQFKITSLPTVVAFHKGKPIHSFIGAQHPPGVERFVEEVIKRATNQDDD
ncbi:hypothetical protein GGI25_002018 [Coemansia spiralis]|uniref:Thioredoxin domain-containing protein n=2 Tax=Coemansia TaxID=4863 RepID=A0A9W8GAY7_9FUNG|nr:thioredoxin-like protein [Coemansia spiralis]KAJ1992685.1 hypothetical protein EDC05_002628 [Coemansia umbellata]KAJ2623274.1 hypothetical protein GGI26_002501 [Coemansia sp. RSA 1358]KAJ2678826.1 hypothetical protein GGI25_002018 [Coemansia spiralis]